MKNLNDNLIKLLNYRIQQEELSSRLYKAMSNWLNYNGYLGAAKLWKKYSEEELEHAEWAYDYLLKLDVLPTTPELKSQSTEFNGFVDIIQMSYDHEINVTTQCQDFAKKALEQNDYMTLHFAQKYLDEQVEELNKTKQWLDRIEAFGQSKEALFMLDNDMKTI